MSAILRAAGVEFDVEAYARDSALPLVSSYKRGDPVFPRTQPHGRKHKWSGVHAEASAADFDEFPKQVADAIAFLLQYDEEIRQLRSFPGVEAVTLDFGIWRRNVCGQCDHFPAELVRLAGELGLGFELTVYSRDSNSESS